MAVGIPERGGSIELGQGMKRSAAGISRGVEARQKIREIGRHNFTGYGKNLGFKAEAVECVPQGLKPTSFKWAYRLD